jgi:hypothetical protein
MPSGAPNEVAGQAAVLSFLLLVAQTAMTAWRGTLADTEFMGGRDNGPAMTN